MWKIRDIKKNARLALKRGYFGVIIASVLITIILGTFQNPIKKIENMISENFPYIKDTVLFDGEMADPQRQKETTDANENTTIDYAANVLNRFMINNGADKADADKWSRRTAVLILDNSYGTGNLFIGILNTINRSFFDNNINSGIIIGVGVIVFFLIFVLFISVANVGFYRYLLEKRRYGAARTSRIFFPWFIKRERHIAWVMLVKNTYLFLWSLTIVGGIIKGYSYKLVPFILAENPDLSAKEAIKLSRDIMNGNKFHAFLLDLSFIGWGILSGLSFGIITILYYKPYVYLTNTELYMTLRGIAKENNVQNADKLCDDLLNAEYSKTEYDYNKYFIPAAKGREWFNVDFNRDYSITSLILLFFAFAFAGWIWEVGLHLFEDGVFVNRGTSHGPWLPIYGFGGVMMLVLLKRFRNNLPLTFVMAVLLSGAAEYITSLIIEWDKGLRYWDYSGYFLNLNGRVCIEGLIMFALGGCAAIYVVAPLLDNLFRRIPKRCKKIACVVLICVFCADITYSYFIPNVGKGITDYGAIK